jgi:hypothetical protein
MLLPREAAACAVRYARQAKYVSARLWVSDAPSSANADTAFAENAARQSVSAAAIAKRPEAETSEKGSARALRRPVRHPHLFKIVEVADLGTKDVNDDIARVDQYPIAIRNALDPRGNARFV